MRTPKFAHNVLKIVTLVSAFAFVPRVYAQLIDLSRLSQNLYKGDDNNRKNPCVLDVSKASKDFLNRRIQTFDAKTLNTDLDKSLVLTGGQNSRPADFNLGNGKVQFNIAIDDSRIEIVTSSTDTQQISLFRVWGKTGVGNSEGLIVECVNVSSYPR